MKYVSLYKKFFLSSDEGKSDYEALFNSPSTIKFNISNNKYPFFVTINNEITRLIEDIHTTNSQVIKMVYGNKNLPHIVIEWIINHILVEEIRMSNEIEGVSSTRKEIKDLISQDPPKHYKRLYGLVSKYLQLINDEESIIIREPTDIRELYDKTMLKDVEKENPKNVPDGVIFRKDSVEVDSGGKAIHTGLNPESLVIQTMTEALNILNNDQISLFVRVAVFHYFFGYIHPFYDGNGRMSRFIYSAYINRELDILCALQLSVSCKTNQKEYYNSFKITNDIRNKGDLTYFVISFLEIVKSGLIALKESIEEKIDQFFYYEKKIMSMDLQDNHSKALLDVLLQSTLFDTDDLVINDLVRISGLSKATVKKKLSLPQVQSLLIIDKSKKQYDYYLNLEALGNLFPTK